MVTNLGFRLYEKYNYITSEAEFLKDFDIYFFDADVGIVSPVGGEVLDDLVGVLYPYKVLESKNFILMKERRIYCLHLR